jgi:hypothetical protein
MSKYTTCEARIQDEFPGVADSNGKLLTGTITQVELTSDGDAGEVVAWFNDEELAEKVCALLNSKRISQVP